MPQLKSFKNLLAQTASGLMFWQPAFSASEETLNALNVSPNSVPGVSLVFQKNKNEENKKNWVLEEAVLAGESENWSFKPTESLPLHVSYPTALASAGVIMYHKLRSHLKLAPDHNTNSALHPHYWARVFGKKMVEYKSRETEKYQNMLLFFTKKKDLSSTDYQAVATLLVNKKLGAQKLIEWGEQIKHSFLPAATGLNAMYEKLEALSAGLDPLKLKTATEQVLLSKIEKKEIDISQGILAHIDSNQGVIKQSLVSRRAAFEAAQYLINQKVYTELQEKDYEKIQEIMNTHKTHLISEVLRFVSKNGLADWARIQQISDKSIGFERTTPIVAYKDLPGEKSEKGTIVGGPELKAKIFAQRDKLNSVMPQNTAIEYNKVEDLGNGIARIRIKAAKLRAPESKGLSQPPTI